MSTQTFDETLHRRASDGTFTDKEHTAPEAALPAFQVAGDDEPFAGGHQQELFPADWTEADFPAADDEGPTDEDIDAYFAQPEPDFEALEAAADVNLFDKATWPAAAPF